MDKVTRIIFDDDNCSQSWSDIPDNLPKAGTASRELQSDGLMALGGTGEKTRNSHVSQPARPPDGVMQSMRPLRSVTGIFGLLICHRRGELAVHLEFVLLTESYDRSYHIVGVAFVGCINSSVDSCFVIDNAI